MPLGKFPTLVVLVASAAAAAAIFGALHNQLSYSVGPSYFTELKFQQFNISDTLPTRIGAALVGVQASWWMGVLVGVPAFVYGLFAVPDPRSYLATGLGAIGLVFVLSTFAALAGLLGGLIADSSGILDGRLAIPAGPDRSDFIRAGFMHDASYLAGGLGVLLAFWPMRRARAIDMARATAA